MAAKKRPAACLEEEQPAAACPKPPSAMGRNAAQECMNQLKRLEKGGRPFPLEKYRASSTQEKRVMASKLALDKNACWLAAEEKEWNSDVTTDRVLGGWLHKWEVADLNKMKWNPKDEAQQALLDTILAGNP